MEDSMTDDCKSKALPLALFDQIELGLVVCNGRGAILYANQTAERELDAARVLICVDRNLRAKRDDRGEFDKALWRTAQRGLRSLLTLRAGDDRLMVSVAPLDTEPDVPRCVLVMLGRRGPCSDLGLELYSSHHGLSLAEKRVLAALIRGATPREIAAESQVCLSTVRTQLASIRAKLGTRSLCELVRRLAEVPPLASMACMAAKPGPSNSRAQPRTSLPGWLRTGHTTTFTEAFHAPDSIRAASVAPIGAMRG
jgi:DNA-binding CsgD family transcriptional regulator